MIESEFFNFSDQVAFVTGAGRGTGREIAVALAQFGATVAICSRTQGDLDEVAGAIEALGGTAVPVLADVGQRVQIQDAVTSIGERFGRLDILVNAAGMFQMHKAVDATEDEWDQVLNANVKGPFFACQAAAKFMISKNYGRIINVTTVGGRVGWREAAAYCASKGGLEQVTRVLALEWGLFGITVNSVAPGYMATSRSVERMKDVDNMRFVLGSTPVGRVGSPRELVPAVLALASPTSGFTTGTTSFVDGGWTAQ